MPAPTVRVVVRLPWNRPDQPLPNPPHQVQIEWNSEKADILWKVIERSRSVDNGGTDWKGLAAHLEVPLPYLLYRVHTRFQEDLKGLQDIQGALSPTSAQSTRPIDDLPLMDKPTPAGRKLGRMSVSGGSRVSSSGRLTTPIGVRARLNSLGANSPHPKKASSSSTLTLQDPRKTYSLIRPVSPSSSEETDSEEEEMRKEEEADRALEEEGALTRKLKDLQRMMTNDALGLVSSPSRAKDAKGKTVDRGRAGIASPHFTQGISERDATRSRSTSQSVSSVNSPQDSIPDIPSPPPDSVSQSPISRHIGKTSSPPAVSPRSAVGQPHRRYSLLVDRAVSEHGSSHGSEASSFSDISDASLSASALESALLSNIRGNGSRL